MLPLASPVLDLVKIAEYWSREIGGVRPDHEIYDELLAKFWQDHLDVTGSTGENKVDRLAILKTVSRCRQHPGFTFIESIEGQPDPIRTTSDGNISVDLTTYIILPSDIGSWTSEIVETAYSRLATMSLDDFDDLIMPGLSHFCTTREALRVYCKAMAYDLPRFWFGKQQSVKWSTRREKDAQVWFRQIAAGYKQKAKSGYFAEAQKRFPGMPRDAFDRIWKEVVPPAWSRSGPVVRTPTV